MTTRRFGTDDGGVNEVIGFIIAFVISAVILVVSTQTFTRAKENTDSILTGVELQGASTRVAARIGQAGLIAQELPNATVTFRVRVEPEFAGRPYRVVAHPTNVTGTTIDGTVKGNATLYRLDTVPFVRIGGEALSSSGWVDVSYSYQRNTTAAGDYPDSRSNHFKLLAIKTG